MSKSPHQQPIEIKISTVVAISTILHSADPAVIDAALQQMTGGVSDFFEDEFAVIDVGDIGEQAAFIDWASLVALLKKYRLNAVAVRGAAAHMFDAIREQGLSLDDGGKPREASVAEAPASATELATPVSAPMAAPAAAPAAPVPAPAPAPVAAQVAASAPATAVVTPGTMIIDHPVRAGQRIYARGCDLIITAVVNNGAEIIADGSIHVYAALHGRALAGASGNADSRIFALSMAPELVSIAGVYRTFDEGFPPELARQPAQIRLVGDRIDILAVNSVSRSI
ncbi:MAG: septum site-determining protein MinC [Pseudomonadota bacterium]